jgi:hypothetical protein
LLSGELKEVVHAKGHGNILATHLTTLEFTREDNLSRRGDCIIAVSADKALADLKPEFKETLRKESAALTILIEAAGISARVNAFGSSRLTLNDTVEMVVRKSSFVSDRTLAVKADVAAADLQRDFVQKLRNPAQKVNITMHPAFLCGNVRFEIEVTS